MTIDLDAIERRIDGRFANDPVVSQVHVDLRLLIAEVRRLQCSLADITKEYYIAHGQAEKFADERDRERKVSAELLADYRRQIETMKADMLKLKNIVVDCCDCGHKETT